MAAKPKLYYFDGRGRMEPIRWLLAAAGVEIGAPASLGGFSWGEVMDRLRGSHPPGRSRKQLFQFEEEFLETSKDLEKLRNDGSLMFQQVPMVEIDGMKLVQCRAILNYIAAKYNLYGKDIKERALIDMYVEGVADLNEMYLFWSISPPNEQAAKMTQMKDKIANRYLPAFEKVLKSHGQDYLVGNRLSRADIHLVELLYLVEELDPNLLANFPLLKALKARISNLPTVKKFLQPGSPRKPPMDEKCLAKVKEIFQLK
uniref:glutathione transferase n=1 Tax=Equus caballus TaxID=9796 RepID=A0A3Q2HSU7_HORSE|nr:glutathione S-transferase A1 isoform X1 [Equus caballus]